MKFSDLKKINFKDNKFIFPIIILIPTCLLVYLLFDTINTFETTDDSSQKEKKEIIDIPINKEQKSSLSNKLEEIKNDLSMNQTDFTAIGKITEDIELERIDSTIYTNDEISKIDSIEKERVFLEQELKRKNDSIREANNNLREAQSNIRNSSNSDTNQSSDGSSLSDIELYQKIMNGEEILTPEQEKARAEERIRLEERQKVFSEINNPNIEEVKKLSTNSNQSRVFNTLTANTTNNNLFIKAMIDQSITVKNGSRIRLKLLEDVTVKEQPFKKGSYIYAIVSGFQEQRIMLNVQSIMVKGQLTQVKLRAYDNDGIEGIYIPQSSFRDALKESANQGIGATGSVSMSNGSGNIIENTAFQTLQGLYQSATQAVAKNISTNKAKLKYNTIIYLINSKTN